MGYGPGYGPGGGWHMMNYGFGGPLMWLLLLALVVVIVYFVVRSAKPGGNGRTPLDILKARYARGEINKQEFEDKKRDLV